MKMNFRTLIDVDNNLLRLWSPLIKFTQPNLDLPFDCAGLTDKEKQQFFIWSFVDKGQRPV